MAELRGVSAEELEQIRQKKAAERGGFAKNLVLVSVEDVGGEAADEADEADSTEKAEPERRMLLCTCGQGDHYVEDE